MLAAPGGGGGRAAAPLLLPLPLPLLLLCGCAVSGQLNYRLSGPPWHVALSDQMVHVDLRGVNGSGHNLNLSLTLVEAGTNRTLATVPGPVPLPGSLDLDCSLFRCAGELLFRLGEWSSRPLPVRWPRFQLWLAAASGRSPGRFQLLLSSAQRLCPRAAPALTLHTGPGPGLQLRLGPGGLERGPEPWRGHKTDPEPGVVPEPGSGPRPGMLEGEPGPETGTWLERRAGGPDPKRGPEPGRVPDQEPGESEGPEVEPGTGLEKGPEEPGAVPGWEVRLELPCPPRSRGSAWTVSLRSPCSPTPLLSRTVRPRYSLKLPAAPCRHSAAVRVVAPPCVRPRGRVTVYRARPQPPLASLLLAAPPPGSPPPSTTPPPGPLSPGSLPLSLATTTAPVSFSPTTTTTTATPPSSAAPLAASTTHPGSPLPSLATTATTTTTTTPPGSAAPLGASTTDPGSPLPSLATTAAPPGSPLPSLATTAAPPGSPLPSLATTAAPPGSPLPSLATTAAPPGSTTPRPPVLAQSWLAPGDSIARFNCSVFESGTHEYCFQFVSADTPGAGSPVRCVNLHRHPEIRGAWLSWSPCSVTCGEGVRQRVRRCLASSPGTSGCGADSEVSLCSLLECSGQAGPAKVHSTSNIVTTAGISFCLLIILATIAFTLRTKLPCTGRRSSAADLCGPARHADMLPQHDPSARLDAAVNIPLGFRRSQVFAPGQEAAAEEGGWAREDTHKAVPPIFGYRLAQQQLKEMQRQGVTEGTQVYLVTQQAAGGPLPSAGGDGGADSAANTFRLKRPFPAPVPSRCALPASRSPGAGRREAGRPLAAGFRRAASFGESGAARYHRERSRSSLSHRPRPGEPATAGGRCADTLPAASGDRCGVTLPAASGDRCGDTLPAASGDRCGVTLPAASGDRCGVTLPAASGDRCGDTLPAASGDRCGVTLPAASGDRCGVTLPAASGDRCGDTLPAASGDRCGHTLPAASGDRCGDTLPAASGDRCGDTLPITAGGRCGNKLPNTSGNICGTDKLPTTAGDRCGTDRLPATAAHHKLPTTAGDRCAGIHVCGQSAAAAETAGGGAASSWAFGEVDTLPGRRQRGVPGNQCPRRARGSSPLPRHPCRQGRCRSFPSEPAAMHFDNTAFELSASEQRILDLPALFGPHCPGDEDSSTFSSDRLVI